MTRDSRSSGTVIVVDSNPSDYVRLAKWARQAGMRFHQLPRGQEALQAAHRVAVDLWIINVGLPDMSGFELVEQLQPRRRGSDVFLVADQYRKQDELRALSLGVTLYLCKPARPTWLSHWRVTAERVGRASPDGNDEATRDGLGRSEATPLEHGERHCR
jgi:DNA-binding response OmpR family regulator